MIVHRSSGLLVEDLRDEYRGKALRTRLTRPYRPDYQSRHRAMKAASAARSRRLAAKKRQVRELVELAVMVLVFAAILHFGW